jgi:hypothetical protein
MTRGDAMDSKKLPITGPCPIDLDEIGFDRKAKKSFCAHCSKNVVNLSNFTKDEARTFLRENAGETMCVSYARNAEGQIKFRPEAPIVPITRLRKRPSQRTAAAATAAAGLALALAACTPHGDDEPQIDRTEQADRDNTRTIIPFIQNRDPEPMPVAGAVAIPEPVNDDVVEGKMPIPEDVMMDGEVAIPEGLVGGEVEPCDGKPKPQFETPETETQDEPPRPKLRGRIRVPRTDEL